MSRLSSGLLLAALALGASGCSSKPKRGAALAPLRAASWREELPVAGFGTAIVALPLGATAPRPVAVVLHGERDRPDWQCGSFRGLLGGNVFILCPRGASMSGSDGLDEFTSFDAASSELRAALASLKNRYGAHVAAGSIALFGYAEGAALAIDLARQEPSFFARVALIGKSPAQLSPTASKTFAERGGKRVLLFCVDDSCAEASQERALWLTRAGVKVKAVRASVGPFLDPPFIDALRAETRWLLEDDARFGAPRR